MKNDQFVAILVPGGIEHAGGIGRWVGYLADEWKATHMTPSIEVIDTRGFGWWYVGAWRFAASLGRLLRLRAKGQLGLIHANLSAGGSTIRKCIVMEVARALRVPVLLQLHSGRYFDFYGRLPRPAKTMVRRMFLSAAQVVALSSGGADRIAQTFGVERNRIIVMPNGVRNPPTVPTRPRNRTSLHIVFLGRLGPGKGVPDLLEALGSPLLIGLNWRATLAGDRDPAPYIARTAHLGVGERVVFPGWLSNAEVDALLDDADLLILPSQQENLPVAVVEALAHCIAVVATPVGALPEILENDSSVRFVPVGNAAALAAAIAEMLEDAALRDRIAAGGHKVFNETLDIAHQAAKLVLIYQSLMHGKASRHIC